jgi:hypothetical protein
MVNGDARAITGRSGQQFAPVSRPLLLAVHMGELRIGIARACGGALYRRRSHAAGGGDRPLTSVAYDCRLGTADRMRVVFSERLVSHPPIIAQTFEDPNHAAASKINPASICDIESALASTRPGLVLRPAVSAAF